MTKKEELARVDRQPVSDGRPTASSNERIRTPRELVHMWRTLASFFATSTDAHNRESAKLMKECADELERSLDAVQPAAREAQASPSVSMVNDGEPIDDHEAFQRWIDQGKGTTPPAGESRVEELVVKWRSEQAAYPDTLEAQYAAAAVRLCADELEAILSTPGGKGEQ